MTVSFSGMRTFPRGANMSTWPTQWRTWAVMYISSLLCIRLVNVSAFIITLHQYVTVHERFHLSLLSPLFWNTSIILYLKRCRSLLRDQIYGAKVQILPVYLFEDQHKPNNVPVYFYVPLGKSVVLINYKNKFWIWSGTFKVPDY